MLLLSKRALQMLLFLGLIGSSLSIKCYVCGAGTISNDCKTKIDCDNLKIIGRTAQLNDTDITVDAEGGNSRISAGFSSCAKVTFDNGNSVKGCNPKNDNTCATINSVTECVCTSDYCNEGSNIGGKPVLVFALGGTLILISLHANSF